MKGTPKPFSCELISNPRLWFYLNLSRQKKERSERASSVFHFTLVLISQRVEGWKQLILGFTKRFAKTKASPTSQRCKTLCLSVCLFVSLSLCLSLFVWPRQRRPVLLRSLCLFAKPSLFPLPLLLSCLSFFSPPVIYGRCVSSSSTRLVFFLSGERNAKGRWRFNAAEY